MSRPRFRHSSPADLIARRGATSHRAGLDSPRRLANVESALQSGIGVDTDELNIYRVLGSSLLTYNFDPGVIVNTTDYSTLFTSASGTSGTAYFMAVYLPVPATVTGVATIQTIQGSGTFTIGRVGVYSATGTRLCYSNNDTALWKSAAGTLVQTPLVNGTMTLDRGLYYIALLNCRSATTTAPQIGSRNTLYTASANVLTQAANPRFVAFTAQSDLAASYTWTGGTLGNITRWVGLY